MNRAAALGCVKQLTISIGILTAITWTEICRLDIVSPPVSACQGTGEYIGLLLAHTPLTSDSGVHPIRVC